MPLMDAASFRVADQAGSSVDVRILAVYGAITNDSLGAFQAAVTESNQPRLIIDMTGVPHVDSMAIGGLVRAYVACQKAGRRLALTGLNHRVKNVLALTGVEALFEVYPSVSLAEEAMR